MRRPEVVKLEISRGDWLLVKKRLTAGEQRQIFKRMMTMTGDGPRMDPIAVGLSKMVGYLLDWNITDSDDKPIAIRDQPEDVVAAALDALDYEDYQEIQEAIEAHIDAMDKLRAEEKKLNGGASKSSTISTSPATSDGGMSGLPNSTEMSTTS
jgi:hypothetical protein